MPNLARGALRPLSVSFLAVVLHAAPGDLLRDEIELYRADRGSLTRKYDVPLSSAHRERLRAFHEERLARLAQLEFEALAGDEQVDWLLLRNELESELAELAHAARRAEEAAPLLPFAPPLVALLEAQARFEPLDAEGTARTLARCAEDVLAATGDWKEREPESVSRSVANRALGSTRELQAALDGWNAFHAGYDPLYTWWARKPYEALDAALDAHAKLLKERFARAEDEDALIGDPIGAEALRDALVFEWIPYSPEELVALAEREFAWCDAEMLRAARELGFGDDWRAAQDHVADLHVAPGEQPQLIVALAEEAIGFLEERELVTIPPLAKESWRMEMMSPERQKTSPYFLGGETILVSFPTDGMEHADKLMSLRGNNVHFARATVHHELIPGHHLQGFMNARHRTYRRAFGTPFWTEGWALYWEMRLWDLGFPKTPEDRVGFLFWRKHRCARIVFSLSFHQGEMSADECVEYLVERVGHERRNAEAEVRRSIAGDYGPLYQCAYMLGGLQFRALHRELVTDGDWNEREFHDAVLRENGMPVELLRAALTGAPLARDARTSWRFADQD